MKEWDKIKVDKAIKPIHYSQRKPVDLVVGNDYYVSFGENTALRCKLMELYMEGGQQRIEIEVPIKPRSKNGFIDRNGNISHHWVDTYILFADEIGLTPEEAVINEVTF
ncbi:MAG: hypothetical protein LBL81_00450 [Tannerella sp.]|jgi:hypothetical protein|nr:hypothetical protein [Tannerella sp.]